ncbi:glycosyltransferase [Candidatus Uhrbacteria bacterium]|nr:glycosyltransferase [Candidatus Uhrbacteria bacterium]
MGSFMKPLTIVMIGQKGLPAHSGGIERHVELLASGLVANDHRVIVYGRRWYVENRLAPRGVEQKFSWGIRTKHLDAITHSFTALWSARHDHPDILHIHGSGVELLTPLAKLLFPQAKIVYTLHSHNHFLSKWSRFAKFILHLAEWLGCHFADRTIAVSETLAAHCLRNYGCQAVYIPHPFSVSANLQTAVGSLPADLHAEKYLLFVGRLIPDKQAHTLIEAYDQARQERPDLFQDIPLVIVGAGAWTDTYVKNLHQLAEKVSGVKMLGEKFGQELHALQAQALTHVFPTSSEGLSIAMLEAAAFHRPMIVTAIPQNGEATGGHALEIIPSSIGDLSRALITMLSLSSEDRKQMGDEVYAYVCRTFDSQRRCLEVRTLYQELVYDRAFCQSSFLFA